ncbi:MAG: DUF1800 family protein, partial [Acidobacteria bacterium]
MRPAHRPPIRDSARSRSAASLQVAAAVGLVLAAFLSLGAAGRSQHPFESAWRAAGLDERAATALALDRLGFGPRPGDVDRISDGGLAAWLEAQLAPAAEDPAAELRLARLDAVDMPLTEQLRTFPNPAQVLRMARREQGGSGAPGADARRQGAAAIPSRSDAEAAAEAEAGGESEAAGDDAGGMGSRTASSPRPQRMDGAERRELMRYARSQGMRPQQELLAQLFAQKIFRAVSSEHQLQEMLVDFWFNHFNVSIGDGQTRGAVLAYERDAIRPHVLGSFREMLEATARHPAMLAYLDNAQSRAEKGVRTALTESAGRPGVGAGRGRG